VRAQGVLAKSFSQIGKGSSHFRKFLILQGHFRKNPIAKYPQIINAIAVAPFCGCHPVLTGNLLERVQEWVLPNTSNLPEF
jgi:hypothetical protein